MKQRLNNQLNFVSTQAKNCIICNTSLYDDLIFIGEQYPSAIYPSKNINYRLEIKASSLNVTKCSDKKCGLVQLSNKRNLDVVFKNYPFQSGSTATMKAILQNVIDDMHTHTTFEEDDVILDIGGNDGTLLSLINEQVKARINIDIAHGVVSTLHSSNYHHVEGKFSKEVYQKQGHPAPKIIFSIAMFYHLDNPVQFCEEVYSIMDDETVWCIQMTYLGSMLEDNIYDNIVHEHVAYYSLKSFRALAEGVGLEIINAKLASSYGGSIRLFVRKQRKKAPKNETETYRQIEKFEEEKGVNTIEALVRFNERIQILKKCTRDLILHLTARFGKMAALGASTKGNMICQFLDLNTDQIEYAIDNNKKKVNRIMTGSDIPIVSEATCWDNLPEYLLVLPYYYIDFFKKLVSTNITKQTTHYLLKPLPYPQTIRLERTHENSILS